MPKIIENIREKLLEEAKRQVMEQGYSAMTIRSVSKACGVGVGTVYNYFPSKDMLVAGFMLLDWQKALVCIRQSCQDSNDPEVVLHSIYSEIVSFTEKYAVLFQDEGAGASFAASVRNRHSQLRDQIAEELACICRDREKVSAAFLAEFVAESILTWTVAGRSFEEISSILLQLF